MKRFPWDDVGRLVPGNEGSYESSHYGSSVAIWGLGVIILVASYAIEEVKSI